MEGMVISAIKTIFSIHEFDVASFGATRSYMKQLFTVVAAAAFIREHSFSSVGVLTGLGRPVQSDLQIAAEPGKV